MKIQYSVTLLSLIFVLAACHFRPVTGGSCTYEEAADIAQVTKIHESFVVLNNAHQQYKIELQTFKTPPTIGARYKIEFSRITQGSCTPISINSVALQKP